MNPEEVVKSFIDMNKELTKWGQKLNELMKCSINLSELGKSHQIVKILMTQEFANQWLKGSQELNGNHFKIAEQNYRVWKEISGMELVEKSEQEIKDLKNGYN